LIPRADSSEDAPLSDQDLMANPIQHVRIQLMTGEILSVPLEKRMSQFQFYCMVYQWILSEEIRPAYLWQMMLLRSTGWMRPNQEVFQPQEEETLYLFVDPSVYEMKFEYAYLAHAEDGKEYDAVRFKIREGYAPWSTQMLYVAHDNPLLFHRQEAVTVLGLSRECSMPKCFAWPIPVKEMRIASLPRETVVNRRLDVLLEDMDLSESAREHLTEQIQKEWVKWVEQNDVLDQRHIQDQQEWERQQERALDW
jgi:hypothetical protein